MYMSFNHLFSLLPQVRTHTHRQQLMDTIHSKTQPYPFDYFFEESEKKAKRKKKASSKEQVEESENASSSSDDNNSKDNECV